ncbi:MAG: ribonuclease III [Parasporobacterium sp.]|nr:ribonuclease III [Parasporobacterium sp.]
MLCFSTKKGQEIYKEAFIHTSYANENQDESGDNERMEFFGDAIIEFFVSEFLYSAYKDLPEGEMTRLRASIVCEQGLSACAARINLGDYLFMGKGEERSGGRTRASITSDAFEALTAAVYLDRGPEAAGQFIKKHVLDVSVAATHISDPKSRLQEMIQKKENIIPRYEIVNEEGPAHDRIFTAAVYLHNKEAGRGKGRSKKAAEQEAALQAINSIK